ncbi:MAG: O-antigen ligase family protein [Bacteroidales bacterium]|nr:O-antigen ligase family protein [Bacteroidales bacterium]
MKNQKKKSPELEERNNFLTGKIFAGLLIIALPLIYSQSTLEPVLMPRLLVLNIIIVIIAPILLRKQNLQLNPEIFIAIVIYLSITAITLLFSVNTKEGLYDIFKTISFLWTFLLLTICIKKSENLVNVIPIFVTIAALIALSIGFYDLAANSAFSKAILDNGQPAFYAIKGLMGHKNQYAISLMLMLPFTVYGIVKYHGFKKYLTLITTLLLFFMIVLLRTRSVWVGTTGGIITAMIFVFTFRKNFGIDRHRFIKILLISIAAISIFTTIILTSEKNKPYSIPSLVNNISDPKSATNINRLKIWGVTMDMISDHPTLGVGSGNWKIQCPTYFGDTHFDKDVQNWLRPHNDYLWVWSEKGILGLIAFLWIFFKAITFSYRAIIDNATSSKHKLLSLFLLSAMISYLLVSFFSFQLERINHQVYLAIILAFIITIYKTNNEINVSRIFRYSIFSLILITATVSIVYSVAMLQQERKIKECRKLEMRTNWLSMQQEAHEISTQFRTIDIDGMPVKWYAGLAYQKLGKFEEAIKEYEEAYNAHPNKIDILNNLAYCYTQTENFDSAIKNFKRVLAIDPNNIESLVNLSTSYYQIGQFDKCYLTLISIPEYEREERLNKYINSVASHTQLLSQKYWNYDSASFSGNILSQYSHNIQKDNYWKNQILEKSVKSGKSYEETLFDDACFVAINKNFDEYLTWRGAMHFIETINKDSLWKSQIMESAKLKGVSVETELLNNANFVFKTKYPEIYQKNLGINQYKNQIINDTKWFKKIEKQAGENHIKTEELIEATAGFLYEANQNGLNDFEKKVSETVMRIKNTPEWFDQISRKANMLHQPLDKTLRKEAIYLIERNEI